jgi:RNA polymerase sigma-32 factor
MSNIQTIYSEGFKSSTLDKETEKILFQQNNVSALINPYVKLVWSIAKKYFIYVKEDERDDLFQVGMLAILHGIKNFDPSRDIRFASFVRYWINIYLKVYLKQNSFLKGGELAVFSKLKPFKKQIIEIFEQHNETLREELLGRLDVSESDLEAYYLWLTKKVITSFYDQDGNLCDALENIPDNYNGEQEFYETEKQILYQNIIAEAIRTLKPKERDIFQRIHLSNTPETMQEIGKTYGISRQQVEQLEKKALRQVYYYIMKNYFWNKNIDEIESF